MVPPGSNWVAFTTPGVRPSYIHICWGSRYLAHGPHMHRALCPLPAGGAQQPFSIHLPRFLLTAVALLSSYSIHLLLKSSGVVGEPPASLWQGRGSGEEEHSCLDSPCPQASVPMSSWATAPSGPRGSWQRPWPSRCRTSEVRLAGRHRQTVGGRVDGLQSGRLD